MYTHIFHPHVYICIYNAMYKVVCHHIYMYTRVYVYSFTYTYLYIYTHQSYMYTCKGCANGRTPTDAYKVFAHWLIGLFCKRDVSYTHMTCKACANGHLHILYMSYLYTCVYMSYLYTVVCHHMYMYTRIYVYSFTYTYLYIYTPIICVYIQRMSHIYLDVHIYIIIYVYIQRMCKWANTYGCFQTQQATLYQSPALPRY